MTENPYAIPVEDLLDSARVPVAEQLEEQPERRFFGGEASGCPFPGGGGMWADADGE